MKAARRETWKHKCSRVIRERERARERAWTRIQNARAEETDSKSEQDRL